MYTCIDCSRWRDVSDHCRGREITCCPERALPFQKEERIWLSASLLYIKHSITTRQNNEAGSLAARSTLMMIAVGNGHLYLERIRSRERIRGIRLQIADLYFRNRDRPTCIPSTRCLITQVQPSCMLAAAQLKQKQPKTKRVVICDLSTRRMDADHLPPPWFSHPSPCTLPYQSMLCRTACNDEIACFTAYYTP